VAIDSSTTTSSGRSKALAAWLKRSAELEGYAAGIASRLTHGKLVTPEERDYVGDVIFPEELAHRDLLRAMARSLLVEIPKDWKLKPLDDIPEVRLLMLLTRGEGNLLRDHKRFKAMLGPDPWFQASYDKIVKDEEGHRAWSRRLVYRLHTEGGHDIPPRVLERFAPFFHDVRDMVLEIRRPLGLA
jgi:hypothetical protein